MLTLDRSYKISASLHITDKTHIRLTGKGKLFFSGAGVEDYLLMPYGTIDDLEIDHLTLIGEGNPLYK